MVTNPRTPTLALRDDGPIFGCDGNPGQRPREVWLEGDALMRKAQNDLVAVKIFGWSALNPADGQRDFEALDEVLNLLPVNNSDSSATMVNHGIDLLTGDVLEGSAALGAGEIRVLREEAA